MIGIKPIVDAVTGKDLDTMSDISELMDKVENHIIDALEDIKEILLMASPQNADARQSMAELDYFHETLAKAYDRAKSSMNHIVNG